VACDGGRHDSDWTSAGDQNVLAKNIERQRGVDGIAEWIEDGGGIAVYAWIVPPDIRHRQRDEFRKTSWAIHAHSGRVRAKVPLSGHAVAATAANDVSFTGDEFTWEKVIDVGPDFDNLADKLVPDHHRDTYRLARPVIPIEDVDIRTANAGAEHPYQNIVDSDRGLGNFPQP
jgi:hypothetical protein